MVEHIWQGVYRDFSEVPASGDGFRGSHWANRSLEKISSLLKAADVQGPIPRVAASRESVLPAVAALVYGTLGRVSIVDFGGGPGVSFVPVAYGMGVTQGLEYHVVEVDAICEIGSRVFADDPRIQFHRALPTHLQEVDVVHLGSSLQYVDDWKGLLESLLQLRPRYIVLTDLPAGEIPTYATAQHYYGSSIPYWFFNLQEIMDALAGYRLVLKSAYLATILGKEQELPQSNFPEHLRVGHACNLLFCREAAALSRRQPKPEGRK